MVASGFGINAKLVGLFRPDPATGRVTAYFKICRRFPSTISSFIYSPLTAA